MRIVAGSARSRVIHAPEGRDTRPTLDRVRENLFNVLNRRVPSARVLDLFAGSGALALEALSRGADCAVLVDHDRAAIRCIHENVEALRFTEDAVILQSDWKSAVSQLRGEGRQFDLIFLDPPYAMEDLSDVTASLVPLLAEGGIVVIEHRAEHEPLVASGYIRTDSRRWGIAGVTFYTREEEA
jgi:16S rRNA (guanine966-N2)-methyltransferase